MQGNNADTIFKRAARSRVESSLAGAIVKLSERGARHMRLRGVVI